MNEVQQVLEYFHEAYIPSDDLDISRASYMRYLGHPSYKDYLQDLDFPNGVADLFLKKNKLDLDVYLSNTFMQIIGLKSLLKSPVKSLLTRYNNNYEVVFVKLYSDVMAFIDPWELINEKAQKVKYRKHTLGDHLMFRLLADYGFDKLKKFLPSLRIIFNWGAIDSYYLNLLDRPDGVLNQMSTYYEFEEPKNMFCFRTAKPLASPGYFEKDSDKQTFLKQTNNIFHVFCDYQLKAPKDLKASSEALYQSVTGFIDSCIKNDYTKGRKNSSYTPGIHSNIKKLLEDLPIINELLQKNIIVIEQIWNGHTGKYIRPKFDYLKLCKFLQKSKKYNKYEIKNETLIFNSYNIQNLILSHYSSLQKACSLTQGM